jgi:hypothetical protein
VQYEAGECNALLNFPRLSNPLGRVRNNDHYTRIMSMIAGRLFHACVMMLRPEKLDKKAINDNDNNDKIGR